MTPSPGLAPDLVGAFLIADLAVILVAARLVGTAGRRWLGQPTVVGEIVAGVLLGPSLLGATVFSWDEPWWFLQCDAALGGTDIDPSITSCVFPPQARSLLSMVGQVGLVFYMFLVGLELDQRAVRRGGRAVAFVSIGATAVPLLMGLALGPLLFGDPFTGPGHGGQPPSQLGFGLMIGAILAVTAFPVMARILEERRQSATPMGSVGIAAAAAVSVLMFLAIAAARDVAEGRSFGTIAARWVGAALYLFVILAVVRPALGPFGRKVEARGSLGDAGFAWILVLVLASCVVADRLGINVIPGAFLIGAILPARRLMRDELGRRLRELTVVVLLPVFLAYSGLNTDFTQLGWASVAGLALILVAAVAGKWLGGALGARAGGLRGADVHAIGVLMNCRGLLVLVAGLVALQSGVISPTLQVGGVLIALVTTVMTAPLLDRFMEPVATPAGPEPAVAAAPPRTGEIMVTHQPDGDRVPSTVPAGGNGADHHHEGNGNGGASR
jgi:Kef-type K+ transport system membrane component KefB